MTTDRSAIYAAAFLRAVATGLVGVELGLYLTTLALPASTIGYIVGAGLAGAAAAALLATLAADTHGRKRLLIEVALLGALGTAILSVASSPIVLGLAAFLGMLNGMGRDRSAALIVEQAILPATTTDAERTKALAWYNVLQDVGHSLGALLAGLPTFLEHAHALTKLDAHRVTWGVCVLLTLAVAASYQGLSATLEATGSGPRLRLSPQSRALLAKVSGLFAIDSFGGGFLATSLLSYFFFERFAATEAAIGALFFLARVMNALSHLGAAWLAARIGLVNTMVLTHIPANLLLVAVAFAPTFPIAAALFLVRESLVEMDVPTRQSYVLAVVAPSERTVASGVTNIVRLLGWAVAPFLAGPLMQGVSLMTPLVIAAAIKITYDILLYFAFSNIKPPEERGVTE
jgi:MFS family permease